MALVVPRWSRRDVVRLPLACDPAVAAVHTTDELADYLDTSDPAALRIPSDATWVVLRPLGLREEQIAERRAGPRPTRGAVVWGIVYDGAEGLVDRLEALDERDRAALVDWDHWLARVTFERVRLALEQVEQPDAERIDCLRPNLEDGALTYPAHPLESLIAATPALLAELGGHVAHISRLGPAGKASSGSPSGRGTSGPSGDGDVPTAPTGPASSMPADDAEAPSATPSPLDSPPTTSAETTG